MWALFLQMGENLKNGYYSPINNLQEENRFAKTEPQEHVMGKRYMRIHKTFEFHV